MYETRGIFISIYIDLYRFISIYVTKSLDLYTPPTLPGRKYQIL